MQLSEPWLELVEGSYVMDGDVLADKFGLTTDDIRAAMQAGRLVSISEAGVGTDAGRVRLTFRYGASAWRVLIEPDGTVSEDFELGRMVHSGTASHDR
jgi:hypothetical protein